jgi:hypothetical protein
LKQIFSIDSVGVLPRDGHIGGVQRHRVQKDLAPRRGPLEEAVWQVMEDGAGDETDCESLQNQLLLKCPSRCFVLVPTKKHLFTRLIFIE